MITGESLPVSKKVGDEVIGGTVNGSGSLRFNATKVGGETALAQIVQLVSVVQNSKALAQRLTDKAAEILVLVAHAPCSDNGATPYTNLHLSDASHNTAQPAQ